MVDKQYNTPMSGADIAKELKITRQAVSYTIHKSMKKMYNHVLSSGMADTPFQAVLCLMVSLGVNNSDIKDVRQFIKMFDKDVIAEVEAEAKEVYNIRE